ncbi:MAG: hypothetical protein IJ072_08510, partial [Oscillospiraceae bacterium]|nr:hypothetical protein [Oscillospiraceae bacterium]
MLHYKVSVGACGDVLLSVFSCAALPVAVTMLVSVMLRVMGQPVMRVVVSRIRAVVMMMSMPMFSI